uniref:HAT C-terminal dimerisation domain-containing protein n=1 Tax=Megaselia scalaris TaxID=36166 RepID=T1GGG7_MEGSC
MEIKDIHVGLATKRFLKSCGAKETEILKFFYNCKLVIILILKKIIVKSPIKFSFIRNAISLDPTYILSCENSSNEKMNKLLQELFEANAITENCATKAIRQYELFCSEEKEVLKKWKSERIRLDVFYGTNLKDKDDFEELWYVIRIVLTFFHGNADVESGFSINKELITPNQKSQSLVAIRRIKDFILNEGGLDQISITDDMLRSCRNSRTIYNK